MLHRIVNAYHKHGYSIDLGNPSLVASTLSHKGKKLSTGGGLPVTDMAFFMSLAQAKPDLAGWFIIGNAFGVSSLLISELFPSTVVDVIDAEVEGENNKTGTALTREIASELGLNLNVTVGFSPQDVRKAMRLNSYQGIFIDGLHTNEQLLADFKGILPVAAKECVIVCHDVGLCQLDQAWLACQKLGNEAGFTSYELPWTLSGSTVMVRNVPAVSEWLEAVAGPLRNKEWRYYEIGRRYTPTLPRPFHRSIYELFLAIRYKFMKRCGSNA